MIIDDAIAAAVLLPIAVTGGEGIGGVGIDGRAVEDEALSERFRELRSQRKAIFRLEQRAAMGEDVTDSDTWSWAELAENAADYIAGTGKDLEPMAMIIEAAVRLDGVPGLERTMALMADLVEAFWDAGLYPPEDEEDGVEARFQPISGLSGGSGDKDGTLVMPLRRMVLAGNAGTGELSYIERVAVDTMFANASAAEPNKRPALNEEAEKALENLESISRRVGVKPLKAAVAQLEAAEKSWRRAVDYIAKQCKPQMPAASRVTDELRKMREWLTGFIKKLPDDAAEGVAIEEAEAATVAGGTVAAAPAGVFSIGAIGKREDALRAVTAAADYFEKMEPLSPLGATLREVDRRARLSLADLLAELIPDSSTRETFYWRSGIKPPAG